MPDSKVLSECFPYSQKQGRMSTRTALIQCHCCVVFSCAQCSLWAQGPVSSCNPTWGNQWLILELCADEVPLRGTSQRWGRTLSGESLWKVPVASYPCRGKGSLEKFFPEDMAPCSLRAAWDLSWWSQFPWGWCLFQVYSRIKTLGRRSNLGERLQGVGSI